MWQANEEPDLTQVILIGDAAANTQEEVTKKRRRYKDVWETSAKYRQATYYEDELNRLHARGVQVHAFYVNERAETNFKFIAEKTGATSEFLDIESADSSEILTNLVTIELLKNIGGKQSGIELVNCYKNKFNTN